MISGAIYSIKIGCFTPHEAFHTSYTEFQVINKLNKGLGILNQNFFILYLAPVH